MYAAQSLEDLLMFSNLALSSTSSRSSRIWTGISILYAHMHTADVFVGLRKPHDPSALLLTQS